MALLDFTTCDDIRAVLGVSVDEIEDATILLDVYEFSLDMELDAIDVGLRPAYLTVRALAESSRSEDQQRFYRATRLYSTYVVAKELTTGLPLFAPQDITDSKSGFSRVPEPHKMTIKSVGERYQKFQGALISAYSQLTAVSSVPVAIPTFMRVSSPSSDPVTGA